MLCLRWQWEDGKTGYCVGDFDSLGTVKFVLQDRYPGLKYQLTYVATGRDFQCDWIKPQERLP